MTQKEAIKEIHDRVRQCFTRHKFKIYGDALKWWHKADFETQKLEAGEQGISKFSTDILWIISLFGPKEPVDYKVMKIRKVPTLTPFKEIKEVTDNPPIFPKRKTRRRRKRF